MFRDEYEKLKIEVREMLIDMEYHHQTDDGDTFHRWWHEEGREALYYAKREQLDRLSFLAGSGLSREVAGITGESDIEKQDSNIEAKGKIKISYKNL